MCISPWADSGFSQVKALSMRLGGPSVVEQQVLGAARKAQVRPVERAAGAALAMRGRVGLGGFGIGRLEAEAAGRLDRAEQDLQQVEARQVWKPLAWAETPRMACMADRAAGHGFVALAAEIGPGAVELECLVEGDAGQFGGQRADARGGDAACVRPPLRARTPRRGSARRGGGRRCGRPARRCRGWRRDRGGCRGVSKGCERAGRRGRRPAACLPRRAAAGPSRADAVDQEARWSSGPGSRDRSCPPSAGHGPATG